MTKLLNNFIKNLTKIQNEEYKKYYPEILNGFLKASKAMQEDNKIFTIKTVKKVKKKEIK